MKKCTLLFFISLFSISGYTQLSDSIVGMIRVPTNILTFCKIDIASGNVSTYGVISIGPNSNQSYCIDNNRKIYYFCEGDCIKAIDPSAGTIISTTTLTIPSGSKFLDIRFNPCDESIYGFLFTAAHNWYFAKYIPITNTFTQISALPTGIPVAPPWGGWGFIDSDNNLYVSHAGHAITALDLNTGAIKYSSPYITPSGENFSHIAFDCKNKKIFGLSTNIQSISSGKAYLSTVNPYNGQVTHVSTVPWNIGYWSPVTGGQCINQNTGDYYYPTHCGTNFIEANTINGTIINSFITNLTNTDFYFIDHFSSCKCKSTISTDVNEIASKNQIYYNYLSGELVVGVNSSNIHIFNSSGQVVFESNLSEIRTIDTESFPSGIYFYRVIGKNTTIESGKFFK